MSKFLLDHRGEPLVRIRRRRTVAAKYDAAQTHADNRRHWANADGLSAISANSPSVRKTLRDRARYEVANNSYARGIINTRANHVIGRGPRLNVETGNESADREIEKRFNAWASEVSLAAKLRLAQVAKMQDGESFALLINNPALSEAVKLDVRLYECDQFATPELVSESPRACDGIAFDEYGNPFEYHLLKSHPGGMFGSTIFGDYSKIDAVSVLHWFRQDRPGQLRGIPEILPALPLFSQLRRFTLAVIAAAESAADFAAVLYTENPASDTAEAEPFEEIELTQRMMTTLPAGYKLGQIHAEQPATTYQMFKEELLNEIARCLDMPYNIAAGNSSKYNYASGRLDHQTYFRSIEIERHTPILKRIFRAWIDEASLERVIPDSLPPFENWRIDFFWDGFEHVDPLKEANAQSVRLESNTTTLAIECAREGYDWQTILTQRVREMAFKARLMEQLGVTVSPGVPQRESEEEEAEDREEAAA